MIRILIRALSPLSASGLEQLLEGEPDLLVLSSGRERRGEIPDIILAEAEAGEDPAWDPPAEIADGGPAIVLLTDDVSRNWLAEAFSSGVRAVLPRSVTREELAAALRAAASGLTVIHPDDVSSFFLPRAAGTRAAPAADALTPREDEVLRAMGEGMSNKEIASRLRISEHTVKFHVAAIMGKLGATSRTEAVMIAVRRGMLMM